MRSLVVSPYAVILVYTSTWTRTPCSVPASLTHSEVDGDGNVAPPPVSQLGGSDRHPRSFLWSLVGSSSDTTHCFRCLWECRADSGHHWERGEGGGEGGRPRRWRRAGGAVQVARIEDPTLATGTNSKNLPRAQPSGTLSAATCVGVLFPMCVDRQANGLPTRQTSRLLVVWPHGVVDDMPAGGRRGWSLGR